jgi:hypothetical protein
MPPSRPILKRRSIIEEMTPSIQPTGARRRGSLVKGLSLALGAAAAGIHADAARALEPTPSWCVIQHDGSRDQPACYDNLITCEMFALAHASSCTQRPNLVAPREDSANQRASRVVQLPRPRAHVSPRYHKFTAEEREELFREFQQWKERSTHE